MKKIKFEIAFLIIALLVGIAANTGTAYGYEGKSLLYPYPYPYPYPGLCPPSSPISYPYPGPGCIIYVKWNATGLNNGSSWTDAYTDLQSALAFASSGEQIWVAAGTYKPTTGTDRGLSFILQDSVSVYGGFAGTEMLSTERDPSKYVTILSGDIGIEHDTSDNSYHVVTAAFVNISTQLDGFTITSGNANGTFADQYGGGLYTSYGYLVLSNITFDNNLALLGGGMYSVSDGNHGHPILHSVVFSNNSANFGGGMWNHFSDASLTNVTFSGNSAVYGGGMGNQDSHPYILNATFSANLASTYGGGIYNEANSNLGLQNVILWGNSAPTGSQIYNDTSVPYVTDSVIQDGYVGGTNIITADPKLGTLGNYGGFTQTIPLQTGSSAIDAGNDSVCPTTDQRGVTRPFGSHCDIGAYEYGHAKVNVTIGVNPPKNYTVAPSGRITDRYGINGGPVRVRSTNGVNMFTSQRAIYGSSFNSIVGFPADQLTTEYWFTSLDDTGMITYLVIGNPSETETALVDVYIGGVKKNTTPYSIPPGQRVYPRYGINGGPVRVVSTNGVSVFTSERTKYGNSFNEVMGFPSTQLDTEFWFTSYDDAGMITYLVIGNPSETETAEVDVYIGGVKKNTTPYSILPGQRVFPRYGINGGPVRVVSTNGVKVFTSERTKYGNSFNEVLGYPIAQTSTELWFTSLDDASMITYLVIGNPSETETAEVDVHRRSEEEHDTVLDPAGAESVPAVWDQRRTSASGEHERSEGVHE
ncbi:MAG: hypothetical protein IPP66_21710 [Anaerolineales bacterium]|nr:hypothetical protein [Anaerolineales bacterium]